MNYGPVHYGQGRKPTRAGGAVYSPPAVAHNLAAASAADQMSYALRAKFDAGRAFELEDDAEFCPVMTEELARYAASVAGASAAQSPMTPTAAPSPGVPAMYGSVSPPLVGMSHPNAHQHPHQHPHLHQQHQQHQHQHHGAAIYTGSPVRGGGAYAAGGAVYYGQNGVVPTRQQYGY